MSTTWSVLLRIASITHFLNQNNHSTSTNLARNNVWALCQQLATLKYSRPQNPKRWKFCRDPNSRNYSQNFYYNTFLELEQPLCIYPFKVELNYGYFVNSYELCNSHSRHWIPKKMADFESTISPSSGLWFRQCFFWNYIFFLGEIRYAIILYKLLTRFI